MQIHIPTVNHFPLEMNGAGRNISICPNFSLLINSYLSGTNADLLNWQRMQIATRPRLPNQQGQQPHGNPAEFIEFRLPSSVDSIRKNISQCLTRGHGHGVVRISKGRDRPDPGHHHLLIKISWSTQIRTLRETVVASKFGHLRLYNWAARSFLGVWPSSRPAFAAPPRWWTTKTPGLRLRHWLSSENLISLAYTDPQNWGLVWVKLSLGDKINVYFFWLYINLNF